MPSASLAVPHRPHPDQIRIAALSAAIALNLAVLAMAMRPLAPQLAEAITQVPATAIRLIEPPPPPLPPMPVDMTPVPTPPIAPVVRIKPAPLALPQLVPVDEGSIAAPPVTTPTLAPPATITSPPAAVESNLAYLRSPLTYPTQALRQRLQGTVLLRVLVDETGKPVDVRVERSSGYPLLDRSARAQVLASWLFQPAVVNGQHVRAWAKVPVTFNLRNL